MHQASGTRPACPQLFDPAAEMPPLMAVLRVLRFLMRFSVIMQLLLQLLLPLPLHQPPLPQYPTAAPLARGSDIPAQPLGTRMIEFAFARCPTGASS